MNARADVVVFAAAAIAGMACGGCQIAAVVAENYKRESTHLIKAESLSLEGKSFAVVVLADRSTQSEHPSLVDYLTARLTNQLAAPENLPRPSGFVPARDVLKHQYDNPAWAVRSRADLAKALGGVDRLIVVEVHEYRLHDPGNKYVWDGLASGTVAVYDPASINPESPVYEKGVSVTFPDSTGSGPEEIAAAAVNTELARRFVDRATWPFIDHQEPYYPKY